MMSENVDVFEIIFALSISKIHFLYIVRSMIDRLKKSKQCNIFTTAKYD